MTRILVTLLAILAILPTHGHPTNSNATIALLTAVSEHVDQMQTVPNQRSIWTIIWGCFATIFACTWIAIHPNIPAPADSAWTILGRRLQIMIYMLVAPEMVILWAVRQWWKAAKVAKDHEAKDWTKTHAFFALMGGFMLYKGDNMLRPLDIQELEELSKNGKIDWPKVHREEIKDKSKGDFLTKGVVLLQTSWFIAQCIARGVQRLVLTELELVTLAFSTLSGVVYFLWWYKPLDVRWTIAVPIKSRLTTSSYELLHIENPGQLAGLPVPKNDPALDTAALGDLNSDPSAGMEHEGVGDLSSSSCTAGPTPPHDPPAQASNVEPNPHSLALQRPSESQLPEICASLSPTRSPILIRRPSLNKRTRLANFFSHTMRNKGTIIGLLYIIFYQPLRVFFNPFHEMLLCVSLDENALRVPTFYAPTDSDGEGASIFAAMFIAVVFGSIHCIAWSFEFPSLIEMWLWRSAALIIVCVPIIVLPISGIYEYLDEYDIHHGSWIHKNFGRVVLVLLAAICGAYVLARIMLLVLPLVALRALTAGAYDDVNWTAFVPHI